ncbi:MAG: hypothetical protein ACX93I_10050 [Winogradskyella sp.]
MFIIIGFVILLLAVYKKNFKDIFETRRQLSALENKLSIVDGSYNQVLFLKNEIAQLNNLIGGQTKQPELVQQLLLDFITNTNFDINVHKIEDTHLYNDDEFAIYSNIIEIEGSYNNLLKLLYEIERDFNASKVVSSELYTEKNYRTNSKKLFLKIILQNYEKNN